MKALHRAAGLAPLLALGAATAVLACCAALEQLVRKTAKPAGTAP